MEQPILNGLISHHAKGSYPWHMPGHKRRLDTIFPDPVDNPFLIDVTEVPGLDEFHHPQGIILEAFKRAAEIYGSNSSYYLINGATCGLLAAISAVCRRGDSIILARNCHTSVYKAVRLLELRTIYIMPEWNDTLGMYGGIAADQVKRTLEEHPEAKAVVLVSPTYEGVVSDIKSIAGVSHKAGVPLIVDEAHGAHFEFMAYANETISTTEYRKIPEPAIRLGADLVVESLHKTLPAMTQCAILHENSDLVSRERLEEFLSLYQSTSPSYVFMASIEACIEKMDHERDGLCILYKEFLSKYRKRLSGLKHIHLVSEEDFKGQGAAGYDNGKLVFSVRNCGIQTSLEGEPEVLLRLNGVMLGEMLEKEYGQLVEMSGGDYVIIMTSAADSEEALNALCEAIETIDSRLIKLGDTADITLYKTLPEKRMEIAEAKDGKVTRVRLEEAVGKISGDYIYVYPPGIPVVAPGEVFSEPLLKELQKAKAYGLNVKGIFSDNQVFVTEYINE